MAVLYVLDTDTFTFLRESHEAVVRRVDARPAAELATTVITLEECLTGWYSLVRRARRPDQLEFAYQQLAAVPRDFARLQILNYTRAAIARFEQLQGMKLNIGGMDLRIAAIVLEAGVTLVTRNLRDFCRVPGLVVEDWAVTDKEQGTNGGESSRTEAEPETEPAENDDDRPLDGGTSRA